MTCDRPSGFPFLRRQCSCAASGIETGMYPQLRLSLFCGEALPMEIVRHWTLAAPSSVIENISVIIPCYGQAHFLHEPIESLLAQIRPELELIVVDVGSPDNTSEMLGRYRIGK